MEETGKNEEKEENKKINSTELSASGILNI